MRKLAGAVLLIGFVLFLLALLAPSAPEGVLQDFGESVRAFWGYPVTGP